MYSRKTGGTVLMISTEGKPEFSSFRPGFTTETPVPVFSITKSLTALACLDRFGPADELLPRPEGCPPVTLQNLLSQTSGIAPGYGKLYRRNVPDVRKAALALPQETPPGKAFTYGPSHYELVGCVLSPEDSQQDRALLILTKFLNRIDVRPQGWRRDGRGRIYLSAGAVLTPGDLLKVARYILKACRPSPFRLFSSAQKITPAFVGTRANPAYGLGFWLNNPSGSPVECDIEEAIVANPKRHDWTRMALSNTAPRDLICMAGSGGQRVYIIPSLGTVIVRLGRPSGFKDPAFLRALFSKKG